MLLLVILPPMRCLFVFFVVVLLPLGVFAQRKASSLQAPRYAGRTLRVGTSFGVGGAHWLLGPSLDLHYRPLRLMLSPGLFYASAALVWQIGPELYKADCSHRPYYLMVAAHDDWLQGKRWRPDDLRNRAIYMATAGLHTRLDVRGRQYVEYGIGIAYQQNTLRQPDTNGSTTQTKLYPMVEFRIGGILRWPVPPR